MLPDMVVIVLRYSLLVLLYLFIIRLFMHMLKDLRGVGRDQLTVERNKVTNPADPTVEAPVAWAPGTGLLKVIQGLEEVFPPGQNITLNGQLTIGRSNENDIVINNPFVSGQHLRIVFRDAGYHLEDLGSRNGSLVNGVRVKKTIPLTEGDQVRIGEVLLEFVRWTDEVESAD